MSSTRTAETSPIFAAMDAIAAHVAAGGAATITLNGVTAPIRTMEPERPRATPSSIVDAWSINGHVVSMWWLVFGMKTDGRSYATFVAQDEVQADVRIAA